MEFYWSWAKSLATLVSNKTRYYLAGTKRFDKMATKYYFENPVWGIKFLKICWYKLQKSDYALDIIRMLISNVGSKRQIKELMKWAKEEDVPENIREGLELLTAVTRIKLDCADMVANAMAKVLPE